jgi:hypothetical protein
MKKFSQIQTILSIAVLIVLTIVASLTDVNQVFFSATPKVELPPSKDVSEGKGVQQIESSQNVENPFQSFLDKKSKDSASLSSTTTGTVGNQTDTSRDPFKEFLDKQKSKDLASSVSPFDAPVQKR